MKTTKNFHPHFLFGVVKDLKSFSLELFHLVILLSVNGMIFEIQPSSMNDFDFFFDSLNLLSTSIHRIKQNFHRNLRLEDMITLIIKVNSNSNSNIRICDELNFSMSFFDIGKVFSLSQTNLSLSLTLVLWRRGKNFFW